MVVVSGDGSIQMNIQELGTAVQYNVDIKVIILNNHFLGMVRQWQERFYQERYSYSAMSVPNFVKLADAYGAHGFRVYVVQPSIEWSIIALYTKVVGEPESIFFHRKFLKTQSYANNISDMPPPGGIIGITASSLGITTSINTGPGVANASFMVLARSLVFSTRKPCAPYASASLTKFGTDIAE